MNIKYRISKITFQNSAGAAALILTCSLMLFAAGCPSGGISPVKKANRLEQENKELTKQLEQVEAENEQLKKQMQVLTALPAEVKLENIAIPQRINITRYTNFYDKDDDGRKEKLIVYIQPIDQDGDVIKSAGAVDVQLWDLNKSDGEALLGEWSVGPEELREHWQTFMATNYRLVFDAKIEEFEEPLTVKVTFTDYVTGKVFKEQRVIEPR